jgi:hypothetical protein
MYALSEPLAARALIDLAGGHPGVSAIAHAAVQRRFAGVPARDDHKPVTEVDAVENFGDRAIGVEAAVDGELWWSTSPSQ